METRSLCHGPQTRRDGPKPPGNLRPISLLSCLGKLFEKMLANRVEVARQQTGAIADSHMGSRTGLAATDMLMVSLTQAHEWLHTKGKPNTISKGPEPIHPSFMANEIKGAFNCILHDILIQIMTYYPMPDGHCKIIQDFTRDRTISIKLYGKTEAPAPSKAGLPQGFHLSPCCLYCTARR